jgi:SAM-dependent methyltransferase
MEALPYEDDTFDLVCGFNSFFFANDIVAAVREAGRVAKPGAPVVIQVWGPHERDDLEAMKEIVRPFMPPAPRTRHPSPTTRGPECSRRSPPRPASIPRARSIMNDLAAEGFVLFAGPLAGTENARLRALLIVNADDDDEIGRRLANDPWVRTDRLVITSIEP